MTPGVPKFKTNPLRLGIGSPCQSNEGIEKVNILVYTFERLNRRKL
jgi:hypothetical protein